MNEFDGLTPSVMYQESLYLADAETMLDMIRAVKGQPAVVMLVGHNPGTHALALELTGSGTRSGLQTLAMQFPTAAMAHITFDVDAWRRITPAMGELVEFVLPRKLG